MQQNLLNVAIRIDPCFDRDSTLSGPHCGMPHCEASAEMRARAFWRRVAAAFARIGNWQGFWITVSHRHMGALSFIHGIVVP